MMIDKIIKEKIRVYQYLNLKKNSMKLYNFKNILQGSNPSLNLKKWRDFKMIEIRFHGRGGQGAVVASKISAIAAFKKGYYPLAFPQFGVERRGAPVTAFLRIFSPEEELFLRCNIYNPDIVVILDTSLLKMIDVVEGLKEGGKIIINSPQNPKDFNFGGKFEVYTVDATEIAVKYKLGSRTQPIVNTSILGAVARVSQIFGLEELKSAIEEEVGAKKEENIKACEEAFMSVKGEEK